ncbi:nucleic acid-binding protein [Candidatus Synechococcus calcipolaris G9]|uniref:Nucleic acid-binding protein n=1 Tax=Candidatus Synechococcus calcipolaris G9 TaxID=1497997 RepID=A0ABT6EZE0_9SYNE|nr:nucleic acid-binding protein [Candidatus Synechococcus calcipolaris]MDG2990979.1 nucleic acid-binding protein [Candidatus Synechococcus calcipolaris G9]
MSEPATQSELGQVLTAIASMQSDMKSMQGDIKSMQGDIKSIQGDIQALTIEVRVNQAKIDALDTKIDDLGKRQTSTDNRLWAFLVALFFTMAGLLAKVTLFDRV